MDRLSALDAEFLYLEDDAVHLHIGAACILEGPAASADDFERLMAARLHLIPRYRQRIAAVPLDLGRPIWVDDPLFDLHHHIRGICLPAPGDDTEFRRLTSWLLSQPLDHRRPLWELWVIDGLRGGRWSILCKVHHSMVDGIAGMGLLTTLLGPEREVVVGEPEPWSARPAPPGSRRVLDAWRGAVADTGTLMRRTTGRFTHPGKALTSAADTVAGATRFVARLAPTRRLSIEGPVGADRVWAHSSASLAHVKTVRQAFGGTVNDVVLAAATAGHRALLLEHGDDVSRARLRSLVPVSTRRDRAGATTENRLAALLCELPVAVADPVDRLLRVQQEMAELKEGHLVEAGDAAVTLADLTPPMVLGDVTRCAMRVMHRLGQPSLNTVTTNVPGPPMALYCLGREMVDYYPFVPISHGLRVGTAIVSYHGRLFFGVTGDGESVPDVDIVATAAADAVEELHDRAVRHLGDHPPG